MIPSRKAADINVTNEKGETPLHVAVGRGRGGAPCALAKPTNSRGTLEDLFVVFRDLRGWALVAFYIAASDVRRPW